MMYPYAFYHCSVAHTRTAALQTVLRKTVCVSWFQFVVSGVLQVHCRLAAGHLQAYPQQISGLSQADIVCGISHTFLIDFS